MSRRKTFTLIIIVTLVLVPVSALAYSRVPSKAWGWSTYRLSNNYDVKNSSRLLGGLDNTSSQKPAPYTFNQVVSQSWSKGGSLSSKISGSAKGLGAEISGSISWNFTQSMSSTQTYGPVSVPARSRLYLYGDFYGNRTTGRAKNFRLWVEIDRGTYEVRSIYAMVFRPSWVYPGGVTPSGLPDN